MKIIKISSYVAGILIALYLLLTIIVVVFYGDEIEKMAIREINKKIDTDIDVGKIELSIISSFPYANLELKDVTVYSSSNFDKSEFWKYDRDTLLKAEQISLSFNIKSLFGNRLELRQIYIEEGKLNLLIDSQGKGNYRFWKENESGEKSKLGLDLNNLQFSDIEFLLVQRGQELVFHNHFHELKLSSDFFGSDYSFDINSVLWIGEFLVDNTAYLKRRATKFHVKLDVKDNVFNISRGNLSFGEMEFQLAGQVKIGTINSIDLIIKGAKLDIQSVLSLLPPQFSEHTNDINSKGRFYFDTRISGEFSNKISPQIEAKFGIENAELKNGKSEFKIRKLNVSGNYSNGAQRDLLCSELHLNSFDFELENGGDFSGMGSISNFKSPLLNISANFDAGLSGLAGFFEFDKIEFINGHIAGNISASGKLPEGFHASLKNNSDLKLSGEINVSGLNLKTKDKSIDIEDFSGLIIPGIKKAEIRDGNLQFNNTHIKLTAQILNPLESLLAADKKIRITGNLYSPKINFNNFNKGESSKKESFNISRDIIIDFFLKTDTLIYNRFFARNLSSTISIKESEIGIENMDMKTLNGLLSGNVFLKQNDRNGMRIYGNAGLAEIDIHELLYAFNNFGQEFLTSEHVIGDISGTVNFDSELTENMELIDGKLFVESTVEVRNGELFDFGPMMKLSKFIMVDDLKHIKFLTLKNDIVIQQNKVFIPRMEINSSAIDLEISGIHDFSQQVSYDVKLLLSDILSRKFNRKKPKEWEIEDNPEDKITLFLIMEGEVDDIKIKYDFKRAKLALKKKNLEEKKEIKTILRQELGLYKKDSTINNKPKKEKKKVRITWDEDEED
ncbi:MAG: AsmA-like C-terminal region-containing protein [Bacteroidota bacterium]|nr:AsmA-like C-terminal region-containing protein [Bacteroidota bacterium]